jgi:hypothetical protein
VPPPRRRPTRPCWRGSLRVGELATADPFREPLGDRVERPRVDGERVKVAQQESAATVTELTEA